MKEKVFIEEAGCNRRKLDIATIRSYLESNGYELVDRPEDADKILVMTCAFKKLEQDESVQRLRHFREYGTKMVVYGCLPDIARERYQEFADIPSVAPREMEKIEEVFPGNRIRYSAVAGSNVVGKDRSTVLQSVARVIQRQPAMDRAFWHRMRAAGRKRFADVFSSPATPYYLFVCRGCMGQCTYCAIRKAIGPVQSKPIADVVAEFQRGVAGGRREFTILGDDPGCYGLDVGSSLPELLEPLFAACAGRKDIAFHLNEIHPKFLISYAEQLLALEGFSSVRSILCPIQSGSDRILKSMHREHTIPRFQAALEKIRERQPQTRFNTEIMVGFPSETEDDFQQTLDVVQRCRFDYVVIFPYDDKVGTASSLLPEKIPAGIIQKRMRKAFQHFAKAGVAAYHQCP
jgi:threonylcarbamoyladenosine tRNA methylthiotransferase CDKAL1